MILTGQFKFEICVNKMCDSSDTTSNSNEVYNPLTSSSYDLAIEAEKTFLLNTSFKTYHLSIDCGISVARDFTPAVRLSTNKQQLTLNSNEWHELLAILEDLLENEFCNSSNGECTPRDIWPDISVSIHTVLSEKTVCLTKKEVLIFMHEIDLCELIQFKYLLASRISMLSTLNFGVYYYNVLENFSKNNSRNMALVDMIKFLCNSHTSVSNYTLLECFLYNKEKMLNDYNKYKYITF